MKRTFALIIFLAAAAAAVAFQSTNYPVIPFSQLPELAAPGSQDALDLMHWTGSNYISRRMPIAGLNSNATFSGTTTFQQGGLGATIWTNVPSILSEDHGYIGSDQGDGSAVRADYAEFTNYYGYAGPLQGIVDEPQYWRNTMPVPVIMANTWVNGGVNATLATVSNLVQTATNYDLDYIVVDDGWALPARSGGLLAWNTTKYPNPTSMIYWIHSLGLKFGLYMSWGATNSGYTYVGNPQTAIGDINTDVNTFRDWHVDLIKLDTWSPDNISPLLDITENHDFAYAIEHALGPDAPAPPVWSGALRPIALLQTITDAGNYTANYLAAPFNLNIAEPNSKPYLGTSVTNLIELWLSQSYADWTISPGHYMEGHGIAGNETLNDDTNILSFNAIMSAPFNVGTNLGEATNIILNPTWRAVFKDPAVNPPRLIFKQYPGGVTTNGWFVFEKPLGDTNAGSTSNLVMLVNNDTNAVTFNMPYYGLYPDQTTTGPNTPAVTVEDVWSQEVVASNDVPWASFDATVAPNAVRLFIFNELTSTELETYGGYPRAYVRGTLVVNGPTAAIKLGNQNDPLLTEPLLSMYSLSNVFRVKYNGVDHLTLDPSGNLVLPSGAITAEGSGTFSNVVLPSALTPPVPTGANGMLWNSNGALYWVTTNTPAGSLIHAP